MEENIIKLWCRKSVARYVIIVAAPCIVILLTDVNIVVTLMTRLSRVCDDRICLVYSVVVEISKFGKIKNVKIPDNIIDQFRSAERILEPVQLDDEKVGQESESRCAVARLSLVASITAVIIE